jgi:eukaryotic translation initiation factor 2C
MVTERLQAWMDMNGQTNPPTAILFYRDGISESQFSSCTANEIVQVKKAHTDLVEKARAKLQCTIAELRDLKGKDAELKELERKKLELKDLERNKLELTFVIVGKRHHTRFYSTNENETNKMKTKENGQVQEFLSGNPRPGLLIDSMVTNPAPPNFYLQSHCALKGTARPAHYHVLEDGMSLYLESTGPLAELTYMLCYAFGRATKGVSYVAPAYIADRLCERGRVYLRPWNMNPEQRPTFTPPKDANGKLDKDKVPAAKHQLAKDLAATPEVWGRNYNLKPGKERLNPWHPCFDKVMFWM